MARRKNVTQSKIGSGCIVWAIFFAFLAGATASGGFAVLAIVSFAIWLLYFFTQSNWAIQQKAANYLRSLESSQIYNGHEFEHFIAQKLRDNGMTATVTPGSGDQGVDILAKTRRGTRIAIQTKLYSRSVTNKAVQEVHAGKVYYNCSLAVVVTNFSFTESAEKLATATGVTLIGFHQLRELEQGTHWIYNS